MNTRVVKNLVEMASGYHDAVLCSGNFLNLNEDQYVDIVIDNLDGKSSLIYNTVDGDVNVFPPALLPKENTFRIKGPIALNNIAVLHRAGFTTADLQRIEEEPEVLINMVLTGDDQGMSFDPSLLTTVHPCTEGIRGNYALSELVTKTSAIIQNNTEE
jgi:hypothetical protein